MDTQKKGNEHEQPHKHEPGKSDKNINPGQHKQGGHEKEHEQTERRNK